MANFGKANFSFNSYASFRPSYPQQLYDNILKFHQGGRDLVVDLGCGHGVVARAFAKSFTKAIGTDISAGMLDQAKRDTPKDEFADVSFKESPAESLPFLPDQSVDMIVSGQAAHWFDYPKLFQELKRIVRPRGTIAFWGYADPEFPNYPKATKILHHDLFTKHENCLGMYWQEPGRSIIQAKYRDIQLPAEDWEVTRSEYDPGLQGKRSGKGSIMMEGQMSWRTNAEYWRTWSSYHGWKEAHPEQIARSHGGEGDVIDDLMDEIGVAEGLESDPDWLNQVVDVEWATGLVLATRK